MSIGSITLLLSPSFAKRGVHGRLPPSWKHFIKQGLVRRGSGKSKAREQATSRQGIDGSKSKKVSFLIINQN